MAPTIKLSRGLARLFVAIAISFCSLAHADDSAPTTPSKPKDVDDILTNNSLRASTGSKSPWSIATSINYSGGTVASPFSQDRPDISASSATTDKADLDGTINVKYNINTQHSLFAGFGFRWIAPLSGGPSNYAGKTFDASNPSITYQYVNKWFGVQSVETFSVMEWTQSDVTAIGYAQTYTVNQHFIYEIPKLKFSLGLSLYALYGTFDKTGSYSSPGNIDYIADLKTVQSENQYGLYPELQYQITPKLNFRAFWSVWDFEHYRSAPADTYVQDKEYVGVGVGYSVTRDIFLYPNIQFIAYDIRTDETNVGVTATINIF